ncbi:hypothetical protein IJF89_00605 [Candidatus Saccharibacteria bacterium]|nr:hypothetical protein [Candidatus Saccharibacteria bacterium]
MFIRRLLTTLLILVIIIGLGFAVWGTIYALGGTYIAPTLRVFIDPVGVFAQPAPASAQTEENQTAQPTPDPTTAPAATPQPSDGSAIPTAAPAAQPIDFAATAPTAPTYIAKEETIAFMFVPLVGDKQKVEITPFVYVGGAQPGYMQWNTAETDKEVPNAFGDPIPTDDWGTATLELLRRICPDPWNLTWFRFECYLETFADLDAVNVRAEELLAMPAEEYDRLANEALEYFFTSLADGSCYEDKDWQLELLMQEKADSTNLELFAQVGSDTNHTPDVLVYFTSKGKSDTFHSNRAAFEVAAAAAKVTNRQYPRVLFNLTEGGDYKWKLKGSIGYSGGGGNGGNGDSGGSSDPGTPASTATPKPGPKNPDDRLTPTQAPNGGGSTNPKSSSNPTTKTVTTSTPASQNTATNPPVATATPAPTAVVRPTETCTTTNKPLVQEDQQTQPQGATHNVASPPPNTQKDGDGTASGFDPNSI